MELTTWWVSRKILREVANLKIRDESGAIAWEISIGAVKTVGLGWAKLGLAEDVIPAHGADAEVRAAFRKTLRRGQAFHFFPHSKERGRDRAKRHAAHLGRASLASSDRQVALCFVYD